MTGVVTPYSIGFFGLFISILPLHPLGNPAYMQPATGKYRMAALVSYALGLACCAYSVYGMVIGRPNAMYFIFPALLYWFIFTEPGKADGNLKKYNTASGERGGDDA